MPLTWSGIPSDLDKNDVPIQLCLLINLLFHEFMTTPEQRIMCMSIYCTNNIANFPSGHREWGIYVLGVAGWCMVLQ